MRYAILGDIHSNLVAFQAVLDDIEAKGGFDISDFNPDAAQACRWTAKQLTEEDVNYLQILPEKLTRGNFTLVHGSPHQPIWNIYYQWAMLVIISTTLTPDFAL